MYEKSVSRVSLRALVNTWPRTFLTCISLRGNVLHKRQTPNPIDRGGAKAQNTAIFLHEVETLHPAALNRISHQDCDSSEWLQARAVWHGRSFGSSFPPGGDSLDVGQPTRNGVLVRLHAMRNPN